MGAARSPLAPADDAGCGAREFPADSARIAYHPHARALQGALQNPNIPRIHPTDGKLVIRREPVEDSHRLDLEHGRGEPSPPPPESFRRGRISFGRRDQEAVVLKAMQVNPKDRYQSIKEMIDALDIPPSIVSKENISIPRKKEHEAEQSVDENESTQLIATSRKPGSTDNEETIFIPSKTRQSKQRRTKSKRRILLPLLIFAFAGVSWAVLYLFSWSDKNTTFINNKLVADASMQQGEPIIPVDLQPQREAPLKEQSPSEVKNEIHKVEQTEKKERNETAFPIKKEEKSKKTTTSKESDKKGSEEASNAKKTEGETE